MIKDVLEKYRRKANLLLLIHRLESLVKSTTDTEVKLKSQNSSSSNKNAESWCYTPSLRTIHYPEKGSTAIQKLEEEEIIGIILHEIGHAKYTDEPVIDVKDIPIPKYGFAQLLNAMEDIRIEKRMTDRYPGTYDSFAIEAKLGDELLPEKDIKRLPAHANFLANIIRLSWGLKACFSKKAENVFEKVKNDLEQASYCGNTNQMINTYILPKIWDSYVELFEEEQENKNQENNSQPQEKQEGDPPTNPNNNNKQQQTGKEKRKEKRDKKEEKELEEDCQNLSNIKDILDKLKDKERSTQKKSKKIKSNKTKTKALKGFNKDTEEREKSLRTEEEYENLPPYESYYADVLPYIHFFSKKLGSIIIDNQLRRKGGAFRSGKLNNKMLYKFRCNNPKLFSKNIMRLHKEYSVMLVVDESGSMCGDSMINAIRTTVLLGEVLDKCNVPFAIVGFNEDLQDYKDFNEPYSWKIKRKIELMLQRPSGMYGGATTDVWGIAETRHRMKQRTGEKIIIVITDGYSSPSGETIPKHLRYLLPKQCREWCDVYVKDEVKRATQEGNILLGIGIQAEFVKNTYPQSAVIHEVGQLPKQVLNLLKRNIKRG